MRATYMKLGKMWDHGKSDSQIWCLLKPPRECWPPAEMNPSPRVWRSSASGGYTSQVQGWGSPDLTPARGCGPVSSHASLSLVVRLQWLQVPEAQQHPADGVPNVSYLFPTCLEAPQLLVWVFLTLSVIPLPVISVHPTWALLRTIGLTFSQHLLLPGPGQSISTVSSKSPQLHQERVVWSFLHGAGVGWGGDWGHRQVIQLAARRW